MRNKAHETGSVYSSPNIKWLLAVECAEREATSFGKKVEKHTKGVIKTHAIFIDNSSIFEPLFIISIEIICEGKKRDVDAFKEIVADKGLKLIHTCLVKNNPEETLRKYKESIIEIKSLAIALLEMKGNKGT